MTSEGEKVKSKHPLLYRREKDRLTTNARKVWRPDLPLELKFLVHGGARCRKSSCDYRHPPVCYNYKSGNRCIYGNNCLYRHADGEEKPSKRSKSESNQGAVAILKEKKVQGCASQNSGPKKSTLRKAGQTRLNDSAGHALKFSGRTWYEVQIRERKGHLEALSKKANLMSEILARRSLMKEHLRKPHDKKRTPAKQHGVWREKYISSRPRTKLRSILLWK